MPPPLLAGSPDSTAALAVHCEALFDPTLEGNPLELGKLLGRAFENALDHPSKCDLKTGLLVNDTGNSFHGRGKDELLVFANLPQGDYRLSELTATYFLASSEAEYYYDCDQAEDVFGCPEYLEFTFILPAVDDFKFKVETGGISYFGTLVVKETDAPPYPGHLDSDEVDFGPLRHIETDKTRREVGEEYTVTIDGKREVDVLKELQKDCRECLWRSHLEERIGRLSKE
jgi:hypothetical protein